MENNKEIIKEIVNRRSLRAIGSEPVKTEVVERLMEAANLVPSCFNKQPWRYIGIQSKNGLEKVRKGLSDGNSWAGRAPLFVLVCTKPDLDCKLEDGRHYAEFDTGMSVFSLLLQAQKEGLIGHPIAGYDQAILKKEFGIPEDTTLLTVLVLGHKGDSTLLNERQLSAENGPRVRNTKGKWFTKEKWDL